MPALDQLYTGSVADSYSYTTDQLHLFTLRCRYLSSVGLRMTLSSSSQCSFTSSISPSKGYHTTYTTEYSGDLVTGEGCSLHLAYTLPPDVFVDPYELKYDISSFELYPMPNLELPVKIASYNTSVLTVHLDTSASKSPGSEPSTVKIPIHARYGEPSSVPTPESSYHAIRLTAPRGYWSCPKAKRKSGADFFCVLA